jgi:hypothetical protein
MKKIEALRAIDQVIEYVEQFKCYELFPSKNDEPYQNLACKWLNHLHQNTAAKVEWASDQISADIKTGKLPSKEFMDLYHQAKKDLEEIATASGWVAGLPCKRG